MQLIMIRLKVKKSDRHAAALMWRNKAILLSTLNKQFDHCWEEKVIELLQSGKWRELRDWYNTEGIKVLDHVRAQNLHDEDIMPLYDNPRAIWGVGANYWNKAEQMDVSPPKDEPICFLKPASSLIGHGQMIHLPSCSQNVTAEAEIGVIIGQTCKAVPEEEAWEVIAGLVPTLDMTAQDIHAKNARFLGRSKVFDTFFSFGPMLITLDEVKNLSKLFVETIHNDRVIARALVSDMIYSIPQIISYFSGMMTLQPGDVIMTGTPGSVLIQDGDVVACRMGDFKELKNKVVE